MSRAINHARQGLVCISLKRLPLYQLSAFFSPSPHTPHPTPHREHLTYAISNYT
ncbi:hypothetical protein [Microcystis aeruginosa]|uniref:hypothetical protein n=1 Tax=Microcystis aeruginosa TaxID=1126 RepID=UPI0012DAED59|nr:hypothetical protein [Microcystis aeruginosa]